MIWGIAYPVRIDSSAIQDPERINISQGIALCELRSFSVVLIKPPGKWELKGMLFFKNSESDKRSYSIFFALYPGYTITISFGLSS